MMRKQFEKLIIVLTIFLAQFRICTSTLPTGFFMFRTTHPKTVGGSDYLCAELFPQSKIADSLSQYLFLEECDTSNCNQKFRLVDLSPENNIDTGPYAIVHGIRGIRQKIGLGSEPTSAIVLRQTGLDVNSLPMVNKFTVVQTGVNIYKIKNIVPGQTNSVFWYKTQSNLAILDSPITYYMDLNIAGQFWNLVPVGNQ